MPLRPKIQKVHENLYFVPISEFSQNVFWFFKNLPHAIFDIMFDPNICIFTIIVRRAFPRSFFTTGPVLRNCRLSNVWSNLKKFWSTFSNAQTFVVLQLLSEGFFHALFYYRTRVKKLSSLSNVWSNLEKFGQLFHMYFYGCFQ